VVTDIISLASGDDRAEIRRLGAELIALRVERKNLLWRADAAVWGRSSPILFPVVGRLRNGAIQVGQKSYRMGVHGFAASRPFEVVEQSQDSVLLQLADDDVTKAIFPFSFRLIIRYRLLSRCLEISFKVENSGAICLPYALGLHPGFAWPFATGARGDYCVEFEQDEVPEVPLITADGLFSNLRRPLPLQGTVLPLTEELFTNDALSFLNAKSRLLRFIAPDGSAIRMEVEDFPHFALWTRPGAPFLCLEAWTGYGDPEDFAGDISEKPSIRFLPPGACARHAARLIYEVAK